MKIPKTGITGKITMVSMILVLFSVSSFTLVGYFVNYSQIDNAAGEELIGCANITTGMIDTDDLQAYLDGDHTHYSSLQEKVNYVVDHKPIFLNASIMSLDGTLLVPDRHLISQGFQQGDRFYIDESTITTIKRTKHPAYSAIYEYGGIKRKTGYAPIFVDHDPEQPMIALMAVDFNEQIIAERTLGMLTYTVKLGGLFPVLAGAVAYFFTRRMTQPILEVTNTMNRVALGDLTSPKLQIRSRDELRTLTHSFNQMYSNLRDDIRTVAQHAGRLSENSQTISTMTTQLLQGSQTQNESLTTASSMVHEMNAAVQSVAKNTEQTATYFENVVDTGSAGTKVVQAMSQEMDNISDRMTELAQQSNRIGEIIVVIDKIADQTNLLALNAAIEAARAGEAGKGFAVVADEVRKLAEDSSKATREISLLVEIIQQNTQAAVDAVTSGNQQTEKAIRSFDDIVAMMKDASVRIAEIAAACEQQAAQSVEVLDSVEYISTITNQSKVIIQESATKIHELNDMSHSLNQIAAKFKTD